jgi:hypothetical protein
LIPKKRIGDPERLPPNNALQPTPVRAIKIADFLRNAFPLYHVALVGRG